MPISSNIKDNHERGTVASYLEQQIQPGDRLSFVSAYFTVRAYMALKEKLDGIESLRFLFGEPAFVANMDAGERESKAFTMTDEGLDLGDQPKIRAEARACAEWIETKDIQIRSVKKPDFLHGKLYFIERGEVQRAISGSSNFTVNGLGLGGGKGNYELNLVVDSDNERKDLLEWFNALWDNTEFVGDARGEVLGYLNELYSHRSPDFVYKKTLLSIFGDMAGDDATGPEPPRITLADTQIWQALYPFQQHGVGGIVKRIDAHGGCILADSVGLGKTFTALAVIKYFEMRASQKARVLVLCPKKLEENWKVYQHHMASKYNPFQADAFSFTLLAHTDLTREGGQSGTGVDLASVRWDNFDLVVIDESHNLRNRKGARYEKLMADVVKAGKGTKFLLLSATPVNNGLSDLHNQIALITGDDDTAFADSLGIRNLKTMLAESQKAFVRWSAPANPSRTVNSLAEQLPPEFFNLLDGLSIARSRKQITTHYADALATIGSFPKRLPPESLSTEVDSVGQFPKFQEIDKDLSHYSLCVFKPSSYVVAEHKARYADTTGIANFSQENRERYLIDMMKVNFLKRLESSVSSFAETMDRTVIKIEKLIEKLQNYETLVKKTGTQSVDDDGDLGLVADLNDPDADPELAEAMQTGKGTRYNLAHMDRKAWIADLEADRKHLAALRAEAQAVTAERDLKLARLKETISAKMKAGDTDEDGKPDRKIVVFTAFADTAGYLYKNLSEWAGAALGAQTGIVTGSSSGVRSTLGGHDFNAVLADFAPVAKHRPEGGPEIDLLIATDCISEGQNLQDCATVVNYDIHWNPVRLIQRFGRVDRIGSRHAAIKMVNFWPVPDLNAYIKLKLRVEGRMALAVMSATGDENLLADEEAAESHRDEQLKLLMEGGFDPGDTSEAISLADFTLEEFRLDLLEFLDGQRRLLESAPEGIFAVVPAGLPNDKVKPGYLFCLRRSDGAETKHYPYAPHYVLYISADGETVHGGYMNIKNTLDVWKATSLGVHEADKKLCEFFENTIEAGAEMEPVVKALKLAVGDISATARKNQLKHALGGKKIDVPVAASLRGYELVTWLAIVEP